MKMHSFRNVSSNVKNAIRDKKGTFLFKDTQYYSYYLYDNTIIATWPEDPNSIGTPINYGSISLDDFNTMLEEFKKSINVTLDKIYGRSEEEKANGEKQKQIYSKLIANAEQVIKENEVEIKKREYDCEVREISNNINAHLKGLLKEIKRSQELGIEEEWLISRNGESLLETIPNDKKTK